MKSTVFSGTALAAFITLSVASPALAGTQCLDHRTIVVAKADYIEWAGNKCKKEMKKKASKLFGNGALVIDFKMECEALGQVPGGKYWYNHEYGQCICSAVICKMQKSTTEPDLDPPIKKLPPKATKEREPGLTGLPFGLRLGDHARGHGSRSTLRR